MKTLFYGGTILTMTEDNPQANAMLIEDNHIIALGTKEELELNYPRPDHTVNLLGQTLLPGFNDSHLHLLGFGESLSLCRLEGVSSIDMFLERLKTYANTYEGPWIRGRGWNQDHFKNKRLPLASDIDKVISDRPVVLNRACGHVIVCNTRALQIAGISQETPQPEGGHFDVDSDGNPTGILRENAMDLIQKCFPDPTDEELQNSIIKGAQYALSHGITSVQSDDLCVYPIHMSERILNVFKSMDEKELLPIRVYEQALFRTPQNLKTFIDAGYKTGCGSDFFKEGPLKILADGSLGARTAFLSQSYEDQPNTTGIAMYDQKTLNDMVCLAQSNGLSTAVHAIGDGTIDMALDAIENAQNKHPNNQLRNSIVHCQITRPEHFNRMKELNVLAHVQPIFIDYDMAIVKDRIGGERMMSTYAWKTMLSQGVKLAFGSDCPVEPLDIMPNIYSAVTRRNLQGKPDQGWMPHERLDMLTVLKGFTVWPAYASGEEHIKGTLETGKLADFAVLNCNPMDISEDEILEIKVTQTWINGVKVFEAPNPKY